MNAPHVPRALCVCAALSLLIAASVASADLNNSQPPVPVPDDNVVGNNKIELFDGVSVKIPKGEDSNGKMLSFEIKTGKDVETGKFIIIK